jgi:hypothetical protein
MTLYNKINWNVVVFGNHADMRAAFIPAHHCPSDVTILQEDSIAANRIQRTNYCVNLGNTNYRQETLNTVPFGGAPFAMDYVCKSFADITDGLSNTLMLSEIVVPRGTGWEGWYGVPMYAGGAGFTAYYTPNSVGPDVAARKCYSDLGPSRAQCTVQGGNHIDALNQVFVSRSHHPGGVLSALCDGSVRFFGDTIDLSTWRAVSTAAGGEPIQMP